MCFFVCDFFCLRSKHICFLYVLFAVLVVMFSCFCLLCPLAIIQCGYKLFLPALDPMQVFFCLESTESL